MDDGDRATGIQSVERALAVLEAVAAGTDTGSRFSDVVRQTGLGRATGHRFLKELDRLGLVEWDESTGRYFPGARLAALGASAGNRFGLTRRAEAGLRRLAERTSDTVYLTLRVGDEALCIGRQEGAFPIKTLTLKNGDRRPLGVGAGSLALLAFQPKAETERLLEMAAAPAGAYGFTRALLRRLVTASLKLGYALNDERVIPGMTAVAVPISTANGQSIAAISVAAISSRMEEARRKKIVAWIREEVTTLETQLAPLLDRMADGSRRGLLGRDAGA